MMAGEDVTAKDQAILFVVRAAAAMERAAAASERSAAALDRIAASLSAVPAPDAVAPEGGTTRDGEVDVQEFLRRLERGEVPP